MGKDKTTPNRTELMCIVKIAEMHPFSAPDVYDVFERCGSIDKTIEVVYNARQIKRNLMDTCNLMDI